MYMYKCSVFIKFTGMVELVTESDTLRKIQTKHGIAGTLKDNPVAEWLQVFEIYYIITCIY